MADMKVPRVILPQAAENVKVYPDTGLFAEIPSEADGVGKAMGQPLTVIQSAQGVASGFGGIVEVSGASIIRRGAGPNLINAKPANTRKWRRMLSNIATGTARGRILCVGDSTTVGAGAGTGTSGCVGARPKSYPSQLAAALSALGTPAQARSLIGAQGVASQVPYVQYDARASLGTGWGTSGIATLGGNGFLFTSGGGVGTLTLTETCSKFTVFYASGFSVGTATVSVDGGASLGTISAAGGYQLNSQTFDCGGLGTHALQINANNNGNFLICGIVAWDDTAIGADILQAGQFGATTAPFIVADAGSAPWAALAMHAAYAADLTVIELGVNDARTSLAVATYQANLGTIIAAAKAAGSDVLVLDILPDSNVTTATQDPYVDAAYAAAIAADVPFASLHMQWGGLYAAGSAKGYYYDQVHMTAAGYKAEAAWLASVVAWPTI